LKKRSKKLLTVGVEGRGSEFVGANWIAPQGLATTKCSRVSSKSFLLLFFKKEDLPSLCCLALYSVYALTGNSVLTLSGGNRDKKKKGGLRWAT
jgi:hypothetical protein